MKPTIESDQFVTHKRLWDDETGHAISLFEKIAALLTGSAECWVPRKCALCGIFQERKFVPSYALMDRFREGYNAGLNHAISLVRKRIERPKDGSPKDEAD
jgi:hypothetical protein